MIVVSDTSPVRALSHLGLLELLRSLFGEVVIPPAVLDELENPRSKLAGISLKPYPFIRVQAPSEVAMVALLERALDRGESEAITLAIELRADFLLIDESDGRAAARQRGLQPMGVVGVLLRAKSDGLVPAVRPLIERLESELKFFLSASVRDAALRSAGE